MRACVNMVTDEKIAAGVPQVEARRRALAECGGIERVKQGVRDVRSGVDLKTSCRMSVLAFVNCAATLCSPSQLF